MTGSKWHISRRCRTTLSVIFAPAIVSTYQRQATYSKVASVGSILRKADPSRLTACTHTVTNVTYRSNWRLWPKYRFFLILPETCLFTICCCLNLHTDVGPNTKKTLLDKVSTPSLADRIKKRSHAAHAHNVWGRKCQPGFRLLSEPLVFFSI
ncbi:hypothetical protein DE146DRAFT_105600 [Phaeosphaeria sp. MPI-PUGE-AT-0046c]|nr:hypothetical protein DE146DRAFT_105600 [Phaeosphaeria sp. MPI-PUGE-AT-0046c]